MKLMISEILKKASDFPKREDKIRWLRHHGSEPLKLILRYALDPNIKWLVPEEDPPYNQSVLAEAQGMLYNRARTLYLFVEGGNPNLNQMRREQLFIELLETVEPQDAVLLCNVKKKKLPYKGLTYNTVKEAFPGLLP